MKRLLVFTGILSAIGVLFGLPTTAQTQYQNQGQGAQTQQINPSTPGVFTNQQHSYPQYQQQVTPRPQPRPVGSLGRECRDFLISNELGRAKVFFFEEPFTEITLVKGSLRSVHFAAKGNIDAFGIEIKSKQDPNYQNVEFTNFGLYALVFDTTHKHFFQPNPNGEEFKPSKRLTVKVNVKGRFFNSDEVSGRYKICVK